MSFLHIHTEDHFTELEFCISGMAKVEIEAARFNDRDIGGSDGPEVTFCELIEVSLGGATISRTRLEEAFGKGQVEAFEARVSQEYQQELAA